MEFFQKTFANEIDKHLISDESCIVKEYSLYIKDQKIGIKIYQEANNEYSFALSHYYHGSKQAGPYIPSIQRGFKSVSEALSYAHGGLFGFYDPNDPKAKWIKNKSF